jgi:putative glutamine amidotransferase
MMGEGLSATVEVDGLVEALEATDRRWVVGVQWHPEALTDGDANSRRLFESFIQAAGEYRQSRMLSSAPV